MEHHVWLQRHQRDWRKRNPKPERGILKPAEENNGGEQERTAENKRVSFDEKVELRRFAIPEGATLWSLVRHTRNSNRGRYVMHNVDPNARLPGVLPDQRSGRSRSRHASLPELDGLVDPVEYVKRCEKLG